MPIDMRKTSTTAALILGGALLFGALPAPLLRAQSFGSVQRARGLDMLRHVKADLEKHYYDPSFRGVALGAHFAEAEQRIRAATTPTDMLSSIADVLFALDDSHTFLIPPGLTYRVDYGWEMQFYGDSCFVSEVRDSSDAAAKGLREGDLVLHLNGTKPTRGNLWKLDYTYHLLIPQTALRVRVQSQTARARELDLAPRLERLERDLTEFDLAGIAVRDQEEAERHPVRYITAERDLLVWSFPSFTEDVVGDGARRMKDKSAVIIDLRGNAGGSQDALLDLLGRFFHDDVFVGTLLTRSATDSLVARGRGDKAFAGSVLVLVDSRSASAAEVFARTMQLKGRARVLGDRTAGAVLRSRGYSHQSGGNHVYVYATSITDADLVLADGSRLEKAGMLPDIRLLPASLDLAAHRDPVLARAAEMLGVTITPEKAWSLLHEQ